MPKIINKFCLICQTNNCLEFINLFSETGIKFNICEIIYKHFGLQVNEYHLQNYEVDKQPQKQQQQFICTECWSITNSFHKLYKKVQTILIALPKIKRTNLRDTISVDNIKKEEKHCDDNITTECSNDDNFSNIKAEPLNAMETVVLLENNIIIDDDEDDDDKKPSHSTKFKSNLNKKKRIKKTKIKINEKIINSSDNDKQYQDNGENIDENNEDIDDRATNYSEENGNEIHTISKERKYSKKLKMVLPKQKTKSPEYVEKENQQIRDFFKMSCEICETIFHTFTDAQKHYQQNHNQTGYLICCKKKFFRRGRISDHINRHLNPDAYKCTKCNKIYADKFALRNHMDNHAPIDKREYKCDICTSSFTKLFKLSQHMRITHCTPSDEKLQCPECDKTFTLKSKLTSHVRGVHESAYSHICHICAKTFKNKQVYELHQRQHLNVATPKLQCKICGAWLKHEHSLRDHMYRHSESTVTCEICNKVKPNKQALGHHMRYVHSERTHQCTLCDKSFKKPIGLKEHMASHTGVDLYTCTYCPKTFKSGANMHSHRKKVHPTEWQSDRIKRQKI